MQEITVSSASIALPFLRYKRASDIAGEGTTRLATVKSQAFPVPDEVLAGGAAAFALPSELAERPVAQAPAPAPATVTVPGAPAVTVVAAPTLPRAAASKRSVLKRIKLRVKRLKGRRLLITGTAPRGVRLTLQIRRGKKLVAVRRVTVRQTTFRVIVRLRRAGKHTVRVAGAR
jgi:hypothetical protein